MGQKVNPIGFRTGILFPWQSRWYADPKLYRAQILEDLKMREFLERKLQNAGLTKIDIERSINMVNIVIHAARPGVVIGRGGATLKELQTELNRIIKSSHRNSAALNISLDVAQVEHPDQEAKTVAHRISDQIKNRYPHRRAVSQAMERVMRAGAKGIKIQLAGRIAGAEIGRTEKYHQGTVPTQTLRNDISYASVPSLTRSGYIGIKIWINRGEKEL